MVEKSDYLIMKLEIERKEMIRTNAIKDLEWYRNCEQRKELRNEMIRANMIKEMEHQERIRRLNELEKLILYGN